MRPSLRTFARRALEGECAVPRGSVVLVAASGGPDSMALLHVLAGLAEELGIEVRAHGVDHGLREDAGAELDLAADLAARLDVPFARTRVQVARGGNLQERARRARHEALAAAAREVGARFVATGHHADDRAETFLLRLLRGSGATGLAVLPPRAPLQGTGHDGLELVRPLLRARRADVRAHLARHHVRVAEDPSNADPRFARTRVRRELVPLLEELGPGIVGHLEAVADELLALRADRRDEPTGLPRATQRALAELLRSAPGSRREVWLPGGLVVARPRAASGLAAPPPESTSPSPTDQPGPMLEKRGAVRADPAAPTPTSSAPPSPGSTARELHQSRAEMASPRKPAPPPRRRLPTARPRDA